MSICRLGHAVWGAWILALGIFTPVAHGERAGGQPRSPMLGEPAGSAPAWDASVDRNGAGLPAGSGTAPQGEAIYRARCERCHGPRGRGATAAELVGGIGGLSGPHPDRTVGSYWPFAPPLFDYIRRAMPPEAPLSLNDHQLYALVAYLLALNGIIPADQPMDADRLADVRMPNRDGFDPVPSRVPPVDVTRRRCPCGRRRAVA